MLVNYGNNSVPSLASCHFRHFVGYVVSVANDCMIIEMVIVTLIVK